MVKSVVFWRILYYLYRATSAFWYWAHQRFTLAGRVVLGAFLATSAIAVDSENNVGYQAFVLLLFILILAISFSWVFRGRFSAMRVLPRFGTVGAPLSYELQIQNLSQKTQRGLAVLEKLEDYRPSFTDWRTFQAGMAKQSQSFRLTQRPRANPFHPAIFREVELPPAPPQQKVEARLRLTPLRRGLLRFRGVRLARPDPLGIFRSYIRLSLPQSILILPKRYALPAIALPGMMRYQEGGVALASHVGRSDEFIGLRDYRPGDSLRHVHWRSWARTGKPVVKEFEDEFFVRHALVLDTFPVGQASRLSSRASRPRRENRGISEAETSRAAGRTPAPLTPPTPPSRYSEAFEEAVSVAASFACTVRTQESLLDLLFIGLQSYCFTAGRGLARSDQMLEVLASVQPCVNQPFSELEHLVLNHAHLVSGIICVLLAWNEERQNLIRKLKSLGIPLLVVIIVEAGQSTDLEPGPMADSPGQFHVFEAGQVEAGLARMA